MQPYNLHGSRAMKCAPRAGWIFVGFGVAISLLFAIFVLALANSKRRVWGFSGSKRIPWGRDAGGEEGGQSTVRRWAELKGALQLSCLMASFPKAVFGHPGRILPPSLQPKLLPSSCGTINSPPWVLPLTLFFFLKSCAEAEGYAPGMSQHARVSFSSCARGHRATGGIVVPAARVRRRARRGKGPTERLSFRVAEPCLCSCALSIVPTCR